MSASQTTPLTHQGHFLRGWTSQGQGTQLYQELQQNSQALLLLVEVGLRAYPGALPVNLIGQTWVMWPLVGGVIHV